MTAVPPPLPVTRTCIGCPSYLADGTEATRKFKKSIGAPICGRFGIPLGRPGQSQKQAETIAKHFGTNCSAHGDDLPPLPVEYRLQVAMPDPDSLIQDKDPVCSSCAMCEKFIPDYRVLEDLGWAVGLCSATGRLILPSRQIKEASTCDFRKLGNVRTTTAGMHLLPEYEDAFQLNVSPIRAFFKEKAGGIIDPTEYETDFPVSEEDRECGIRAWRKILDPAGTGNEARLPIYDSAFFSEEEAAKIPKTGDDSHPELYVDHFGGMYMLAITWRELDETPAIWGEAGLGKTELFRHAAWKMNLPFYRISITGSTEVDDLVGKMHFRDGETRFEYGRLPQAWTKPCVLCLDEPNVAEDPAVWHVLRPLTDNAKQMALDMNEGEILVRHNDCYMGMAMNPAWDVRNVGAQPIGDADANRLFHVYLELPPPELEREIIKARVALDGWEVDDVRLGVIMAVATDLRALAKEGTIPVSWGIRPQIKVARAMRWFDPITSYRRAVADFLEPEAAAVVIDAVKAHIE